MSFDLARALRRIKPQRRTVPFKRRSIEVLPTVAMPISAGAELLLDTCVYIGVLQGRTPLVVDEMLEVRVANHSTICLAEMTYLFGRLDPGDPRTKRVLDEIRRTVADIPSHRLSSPSDHAMGEAGMFAGFAARLLNVQRQDQPLLLNDAALYLQAFEHGWTILTRNVRDYDCFDQLLPAGRVIFYEAKP